MGVIIVLSFLQTVKNVFMRNNYYKKFVTNYKECQFNAFLQCILDENRSLFKIKKDSYTGRKIKNFYNPDDIYLSFNPDIPDDDYSFASGIVKEYNLDPEAVIFTRGYWEDALKLFGGLQFDGNNTGENI
jgi:hypothetical protein